MKMNKQEVIASIKGYSMMHDEIKSLIASVTSAEDVENAIATFHKQEKAALKRESTWRITAICSTVAFFASLAFMLLGPALGFYETAAWEYLKKSETWGYIFAVPAFFGVLAVVSNIRRETQDKRASRAGQRAEFLMSIEGTDSCQLALEYVQAGYPAVMAWRDMVMAERGTLRHIDVDIMGSLHRKAERELAEAQAQARNAQACRAVHGVSSPDSADFVSA